MYWHGSLQVRAPGFIIYSPFHVSRLKKVVVLMLSRRRLHHRRFAARCRRRFFNSVLSARDRHRLAGSGTLVTHTLPLFSSRFWRPKSGLLWPAGTVPIVAQIGSCSIQNLGACVASLMPLSPMQICMAACMACTGSLQANTTPN
jgi:hypothetical protein